MQSSMKIFIEQKIYVLLFIFISTSILQANISDSSIVGIHGQLSVQGNRIVDNQNEPIVLRGMSLFWSQWMGQYYNSQSVKWLKDDWNSTVVRAAMGVEMGGYLENPSFELSKIKNVIEACIDEGLYVIVDWHDHHAQRNQEEAINFFKEIATLYGDSPNIIYEIYNEPLQISWADSVKPYAEAVISEIREIDSNNLILVGSPTWSQDVDVAANNPIESNNIAYTLHFYAATHKQFLRDKAKRALDKGVALFVSEYGTCESSGDGFLDYDETSKWFDFMEENQISYCNWSIADKVETASALKPGSSAFGGWTEEQITPSGKLIRDQLLFMNTVTDIEDMPELDDNNILLNYVRNYPNPFNSTTIIQFSLNRKAHLKMKILNMLGENVMNLVDSVYESGTHSFPVNFNNFPSGNYLLSYKTQNDENVIKLQYIK